jgi:hypothetical protein
MQGKNKHLQETKIHPRIQIQGQKPDTTEERGCAKERYPGREEEQHPGTTGTGKRD